MAYFVAWLRHNLAWSNSRRSWQERGAAALVLAGAAALVLAAGRLSLARQVVLWGLLLAAVAVVARRGWLRLFGPVLFYDLVRVARRVRYYVIRVLYALFLLAMLGWLYLAFTADSGWERTVAPGEASRFANSFFYMFMGVQFLIVTVVTPAFVAGAVAEEKERKTLEFLLATDLNNREIVLSKLASRLLNLLMLVLTGLPILAGLQFMGGVGPELVLAGFAATLLTVASLAGLSILNSVLCRRARDAIVMTYLMAAAYLALSGLSWFLLAPAGWADFPSPTAPLNVRTLVEGLNVGNVIAVLVRMSVEVNVPGGRPLDEILPGYLRNYALFHGAIAVGGPLYAVLRLRAVALSETGEPARRERRAVRLWRRVRLGKHPMVWKEVFADPGMRLHWIGKAIILLLVLVSFAPVVVIGWQFLLGTLDSPLNFFGGRPDEWTALAENTQLWVVRLSGTAVACLLLLAVAVRAASGVSSERDRQTFDGLLTTPMDSDTILFGKWLGAVLSVRRGWLWLGALWGVGVLTAGLHPLALLLLVVTWFVYAAFLAGLGSWFSTVCRTTMRATAWTLVCAVAAALGHWLVWMCCVPVMIVQAGPMPGAFAWVAKYQTGLTPPANFGFLSSFREGNFDDSYSGGEQVWEMVGFGILGTMTWAALAAALWFATSRRFRVLTGRAAFRPERRVRAKPRPRPPARPRPRVAGSDAVTEAPPDAGPVDGDDEERIKGADGS